MLIIAVALLGGSIAWTSVASSAAEQRAQSTAVDVARPLARICDDQPATAAAAGADCEKAAQVAAQPVNGRDGRGITGTTIRDGHLVVTYDDGTSRDVGQVVGADGRSIASTLLENGRLILVLSDGTRSDLGLITGPAGRGIAAASTDGGRLRLTLDDGSVLDAGPLPVGPKGDDGQTGAPGPTCPEGFAPIETEGATGVDGTTYARAITCVDPTSAKP
ncbi:hypothetical protein [Pseudonocardia dioxanivorans]|uniref:hypothetical protein n=1 Tax=Pseudonocardia dioxanivorans TaxID=240495 RepID=UPI00059F5EA5|nr:hypothetical protein [Pseudonocardia dioxanivorans]